MKLSMPLAISVLEYSIDCLVDAKNVTVPFELEGFPTLVELQIGPESPADPDYSWRS
ncbi:hypothetical protein [Malonomonas rubra]|uniref:hypothetical protein n=1 Tax=Malonomonas rubra TaxID=57040 RepID=UPI0026EEF225|nr:hypothetical protein [Malonomonas rubra]